MTAAPAENSSQPVCSGNCLEAGGALCAQGGCTRAVGESTGCAGRAQGGWLQTAPAESPAGPGAGLHPPTSDCPLMAPAPESAAHPWTLIGIFRA